VNTAELKIGAYLHLQEADLVEAAGEDVDDVAVLHRLVGQPVVELTRRLVGLRAG